MTREQVEQALRKACNISGNFEPNEYGIVCQHWYDFSTKRVVTSGLLYVQPYNGSMHKVIPYSSIKCVAVIPKDIYTLVFITLVNGLDIQL